MRRHERTFLVNAERTDDSIRKHVVLNKSGGGLLQVAQHCRENKPYKDKKETPHRETHLFQMPLV